jgi:hypothetical protein
MQNEQIVYFQSLDMGWVVSERVLKKIDSGSFRLSNLGEVSVNPEGKPGTDVGTERKGY